MNLLANPCFADTAFLEARSSLITRKCDEILFMSNEIGSLNTTIDHILLEVGIFDEACDCPFPFTNTRGLTVPSHISFETKEDLQLNRLVARVSGSNDALWGPDPSTPFAGNSTVCNNPSYAREYLRAPEASASFWDIWIKTGLFAMILVKITIANFGVSLMRFADPFSPFNGKYECPPERYDSAESEEDMQELKDNMHSILKLIGARRTLFWGFLTNMGLINMYISQLVAHGGEISSMKVDDDEWAMFVSFVGVGVIVPVAVYFRAALHRDIVVLSSSCGGVASEDGVAPEKEKMKDADEMI
eukprot:CAMPEP_0197233954 /NCGR_PEP_ID=MMETSP1429-20130617/1847_1 /TAXON_ID=49237 /ORGANISM="Chaetoceros  sp., Strain UNC1202" /LENGTH=302 /DNA_ID=CAMNT_0042692271 /DNA_START=24 /DNA_END=932 /DNA_ORIENTATION=-